MHKTFTTWYLLVQKPLYVSQINDLTYKVVKSMEYDFGKTRLPSSHSRNIEVHISFY